MFQEDVKNFIKKSFLIKYLLFIFLYSAHVVQLLKYFNSENAILYHFNFIIIIIFLNIDDSSSLLQSSKIYVNSENAILYHFNFIIIIIFLNIDDSSSLLQSSKILNNIQPKIIL